jgi:hypothetical protein
VARQAADLGNTDTLHRLAMMREIAGDREGAEAVARQAADHGDAHVLYSLAEIREEAGEREGAEALARQAADVGDAEALYGMAMRRQFLDGLWPNGLDPDGTPTPPWQPSASALHGRYVPSDTPEGAAGDDPAGNSVCPSPRGRIGQQDR